MKIKILATSLLLASAVSSQAKAQDIMVEIVEAPDNFVQVSTPTCGYCPQFLEPLGDIAWTKSSQGATNAALCYDFVKFEGDDETDCIVRYSNYSDNAQLVDTTKTKWISMKYSNGLAAYTSAGEGLFLRMDNLACSNFLNAQDHVRVDL
ncbi:hypothetical protein [Pseudoalteromonas luteoviolacea]|uniref:Uncharacterized protein n=1 Tax=Pseudoalteromonas luteoviolacea NCIMB 1942 TaxID=1365253 RepID=A0A166Z5L2_9GAMM|nr:hypothetical protein [Pseudoalteromonas luteoviolacea]KZN43959.1 hypothetical protein N482_18170 [Pseudoalteromonas luteoviolacea NCIMB 1942]KZX02248.1 hypothetical protein JL49_01020 [Pseudoalteromonas luteoviolacea]